jgi:hypothetical protein
LVVCDGAPDGKRNLTYSWLITSHEFSDHSTRK